MVEACRRVLQAAKAIASCPQIAVRFQQRQQPVGQVSAAKGDREESFRERQDEERALTEWVKDKEKYISPSLFSQVIVCLSLSPSASHRLCE